MKIVLFQPQIPPNTGNIVRTCAVTGCSLLLVKPLGFSVSSRHLKRAGLDYWQGVDVAFCDDLESYLESIDAPFYFFSSKASLPYTSPSYTKEDHLIFGSETEGLPLHYHQRWPERFVKIPQLPGTRCLNLANAVAISIYEAWRHCGFL